jgi:hypothetical protein
VVRGEPATDDQNERDLVVEQRREEGQQPRVQGVSLLVEQLTGVQEQHERSRVRRLAQRRPQPIGQKPSRLGELGRGRLVEFPDPLGRQIPIRSFEGELPFQFPESGPQNLVVVRPAPPPPQEYFKRAQLPFGLGEVPAVPGGYDTGPPR